MYIECMKKAMSQFSREELIDLVVLNWAIASHYVGLAWDGDGDVPIFVKDIYYNDAASGVPVMKRLVELARKSLAETN